MDQAGSASRPHRRFRNNWHHKDSQPAQPQGMVPMVNTFSMQTPLPAPPSAFPPPPAYIPARVPAYPTQPMPQPFSQPQYPQYAQPIPQPFSQPQHCEYPQYSQPPQQFQPFQFQQPQFQPQLSNQYQPFQPQQFQAQPQLNQSFQPHLIQPQHVQPQQPTPHFQPKQRKARHTKSKTIPPPHAAPPVPPHVPLPPQPHLNVDPNSHAPLPHPPNTTFNPYAPLSHPPRPQPHHPHERKPRPKKGRIPDSPLPPPSTNPGFHTPPTNMQPGFGGPRLYSSVSEMPGMPPQQYNSTPHRTPQKQNNGTPTHGTPNRQSGKKQRKQRVFFQDYECLDKVEEGLADGTLVKGQLRINQKRRDNAYVTVEGLPYDIFINGGANRNRAYHGDIVVVKLLEKSKWKALSEEDDKDESNGAPQDPLDEEGAEVDEDAEEEVSLKDAEIDKLSSDLQSKTVIVSQTVDSDASRTVTTTSTLTPSSSSTTTTVSPSLPAPSPLSSSPSVPTPLHSVTSVTKSVTVTPSKIEAAQAAYKDYLERNDMLPDPSKKHWVQRIQETSPSESARQLIESANKEKLQVSGVVVFIVEAKHSDTHIGVIKATHPNGKFRPEDKFAMFQPVDQRMPRLLIFSERVPAELKTPEGAEYYVEAKIIGEWKPTFQYPIAQFCRVIGKRGDMAVEKEALLVENNVDSREFSPGVSKCVAKFANWSIDKKELANRRDLRKLAICTIDPPTAKDLDDALSCERNADGTFEVGVHIADVSYFVTPRDAIDLEAKSRCTTVYLVDKAIPMLPPLLCEQLCSLNMGVDRYAFSVMWTLDKEGNILKEWFGRTVIRSCCRMSYDVAQLIIEGKVQNSWDEGLSKEQQYRDLGPDTGHSVGEVATSVQNLQSIAVHLRKKRFDSGALAINQIKLSIRLDEKGNPVSWAPYIMKDSNHMIEEFMLLANMRVAKKLADSFPDSALLRNHLPPFPRRLEELEENCRKLGLLDPSVNLKNPRTLARDIEKLKKKCGSPVKAYAVEALCTKPMQVARYFCTGTVDTEDWHHFALNVDYYTHFTSPIRRYADLIVHRLLDAALTLETTDNFVDIKGILEKLPTKYTLDTICKRCNEKKTAAKFAQEASNTLYLTMMLKDHPYETTGVVLSTGEKYLQVLIPDMGEDVNAFFEDTKEIKSSKYDDEDRINTVTWDDDVVQTIGVLSEVRVRVAAKEKGSPNLAMTILHP